MRNVFVRLLGPVLLFALLVLAACSSKSPSVTSLDSTSTIPSPSSTPIAQAKATDSNDLALAKIRLESTKIFLSEDPVVLSYRTILLFERAADQMIAYMDKTLSGQIQPGDSTARTSYFSSFPVAMEAFKQTPPPPQLNEAWRQVTSVTQQYNQAYDAMSKGSLFSNQDLSRLKASRQILANYHKIVEKNLSTRGLSPDFLSYQQNVVCQLLQEKAGDQPGPTPTQSAC